MLFSADQWGFMSAYAQKSTDSFVQMILLAVGEVVQEALTSAGSKVTLFNL